VVTTENGVPRKVGVHREPGSLKVVVWGTVPAGAQALNEAIAIEDPAEYTARLFRELLEKRGIKVTGKAYARHGDIAQFFDLSASSRQPVGDGASSSEARSGPQSQAQGETREEQRPVLAEHVSLPLLEDLRVINKTSQNLHAELVLRLVARTLGTGGSVEGSVAALKKWLQQAGLAEDEFYLQDGSGLSRRDLISPAAMVRLLDYAARQPWSAAFEDTLPVAALDGSLSERFLNSPAAGLIHAKTGTLGHVNALSGYGETLSGRKFIFSIFCNNHNQPSSKVIAAIDSIVTQLVEDSGPAKSKPRMNANKRE
jgi:D-alanyl-D-alanine carboxypeptidase/D-alanyl-D-alanine-endopeptidase (penicillin-binding protein 4)